MAMWLSEQGGGYVANPVARQVVFVGNDGETMECRGVLIQYDDGYTEFSCPPDSGIDIIGGSVGLYIYTNGNGPIQSTGSWTHSGSFNHYAGGLTSEASTSTSYLSANSARVTVEGSTGTTKLEGTDLVFDFLDGDLGIDQSVVIAGVGTLRFRKGLLVEFTSG